MMRSGPPRYLRVLAERAEYRDALLRILDATEDEEGTLDYGSGAVHAAFESRRVALRALGAKIPPNADSDVMWPRPPLARAD